MSPIRDSLEKIWRKMSAGFDDCKGRLLQSLLKLLDGIRDELKGEATLLSGSKITLTISC